MRPVKWLIEALLKNPRLDAYLRKRYGALEPFPRGHYYSPLPDVCELVRHADSLFRADVDLGPSIDLRADAQRCLLEQLTGYYPDFDWPDEPDPRFRYHLRNGFYRNGDGYTLYAMLRHFRPRRVVEIGSGYSSALMLDVNDRYLGGGTHFTFIDPEPQRLRGLLRPTDQSCCEVLPFKVQDLPLATFEALGENDLLFIDSSHVAKVGSDVNYLFFDVLPSLRPKVLVHVHDVFWPFEYPLEWYEEGRAWNEVYLVRAFLQYNARFEIVLFNDYLRRACREQIEHQLPRVADHYGVALWLRKA